MAFCFLKYRDFNNTLYPRLYSRGRHLSLPQCTQPVVAFGDGGLMVDVCVFMVWHTVIHIFNGTLTDQHCNEKIILRPVLNRGEAIGCHKLIFPDDNKTPNRSPMVLETLKDNEITHIPL